MGVPPMLEHGRDTIGTTLQDVTAAEDFVMATISSALPLRVLSFAVPANRAG
jgi:hypothetical protein